MQLAVLYKHMCSLEGAVGDRSDPASGPELSPCAPRHCVVFLGTTPPRCINWVPANLLLESTLRWTSIPEGSRNSSNRFMPNLPRMQTLLFMYNNSSFLFVTRFQAGQHSSLDSLLNFVKTKLYSQAINEKNPMRRILFIIAESTVLSSEKLTALPAKNLHDNGIEVFLLTVGKHVTNNDPNKVASKPLKTHLFRVNSFPDLPRLSKAFKGKGKLFLHSHILV